MQAQRCFYLFPEESLYLHLSSCGYYASKSITAMLGGRLCWRLNAQNQTNVRGEDCGSILFAEEQKKRWCLSETGESCSWWGSRVASRIIAETASVRWWEVGGFAGIEVVWFWQHFSSEIQKQDAENAGEDKNSECQCGLPLRSEPI